MQRIKLNDLVQVITGKDKGKQGHVMVLKGSRIKVRGVGITVRHVKPTRQGQQGGIRQEEGFIQVSNVMPVGPDGKPCRVRYQVQEGSSQKVRVCARTGKPLA